MSDKKFTKAEIAELKRKEQKAWRKWVEVEGEWERALKELQRARDSVQKFE